MDQKIAGAILLSSAGFIATIAGIAAEWSNRDPCWQSTVAALVLGGIGLYFLFDRKFD